MTSSALIRKAFFAIASVTASIAISQAQTASGIHPRMDFHQLEGDPLPVFSLCEDTDGYLWAGSVEGLIRHDSHKSRIYRHDPLDSASICSNTVNVLLQYEAQALPLTPGEGRMIIAGTSHGASVYNCMADSFSTLEWAGDRNVKSMLICSDSLWTGTLSGLLLWEGGRIHEYSTRGSGIYNIPDERIARCRKIDGTVWFTSDNRIYRLMSDGSLKSYIIPYARLWHSNMVSDLCADPRRKGVLLLGTEHGLFSFDILNGKCEILGNVPVKCLKVLSDGTVLAGTDAGIVSIGPSGQIATFTHEPGNSLSLPDNVVSAIMEDRFGNIWAGTDHGVCISSRSTAWKFVSVEDILGKTDGFQVRVIARDGRGGLWFGGKNGLLYSSEGKFSCFKADSGALGCRLANNKVRALLADGDSGMWIASDGGLDRFDLASGKIRHFTITESTGRYNSSWMYDIKEDSRGRLWLATYEGGLFVVDKASLIAAGNNECMAQMHFCTENCPSLPSNIISKVELFSNTCFAAADGGAVDIDMENGSAKPLPLPEGIRIQAMLSHDKALLIGTNAGLYSYKEGTISLLGSMPLSIQGISAGGSRICTVSEGILSIFESGQWFYQKLGDISLLTCFDNDDKTIFAGTADGWFTVDPENFKTVENTSDVLVTGLFIDNHEVLVGEKAGRKPILTHNISYTESIVLPPDRNSFAIEFSNFDFSHSRQRYAYRLTGLSDSWQVSEAGSNRATFINVPPGRYRFEVGAILSGGGISNDTAVLAIRIRPHWYASPLAYCIYFLTLATLLFAFILAARSRRMLREETAQRDKVMQDIRMKDEFFDRIAQEFRTPLGIIMDQSGKMIASEAGHLHTEELSSIRQNSDRIHILINQMLAVNKGNGGAALFIPTATSIGDMVRAVYDKFLPEFRNSGINSRFVCDKIGYIFMIDRVRMESAISHLISNAIRFTPRGGSVLVSVAVSSETDDMIQASITVEDTGRGIEAQRLGTVFNEYNATTLLEGEGQMRLYMVKDIVEQCGGSISVSSEAGRGARFVISLSTMKADSFVIREEKDETALSLHSLSKVWSHKRKPIILLVEDNDTILDIITASLGDDYTFICERSGKAGLASLANNKTDLIITDLALPEMDGRTMIRRIRKSLDTTFLPIIAIGAKSDIETKVSSYEFADAYVPWPFSLKYLNSRIIQLLIKHEHYLEKLRSAKLLSPEMETVVDPDEQFLKEIVEIINAHIDDPNFSAGQLGELSRWPPKQVYRKIRHLCGLSMVEFIRDIRLRKAAMYLSQKKLTVQEVMYMVGFTTPSYFSKCFKERFGVNPSDYTGDPSYENQNSQI